MELATSHVPEAFRSSFLHRNPLNAALLAMQLRYPPPHNARLTPGFVEWTHSTT
jgi:hypothetical protein